MGQSLFSPCKLSVSWAQVGLEDGWAGNEREAIFIFHSIPVQVLHEVLTPLFRRQHNQCSVQKTEYHNPLLSHNCES